MTIEHHILKKIITRIVLVLSLFFTSLPTLAQNSDNTIIWSEDFNSRFEVPTMGKNATYTYSGTVTMSRQKHTGCIAPELQIGQGGCFVATVSLYGASGECTLSFKNYNNRTLIIAIKRNDTTLDYKKDSNGNIVFSIPESSESITISFTNENTSLVYLDDIILSGSANCRQAGETPELSFSTSEATVTYGGIYNLPSLNNPYNLPIYYWNTNDSIALVDKDGNVTINDIGSTVIYAIFYGDNNYSYQEVSYTLNVKRDKPIGEIFYESFDKNLSEGGNDGNFGNPTGYIVEYDQPSFVKSNTHDLRSAYKCIIIGKKNGNDGSYNICGISGLNGKCRLSFKIAGMNGQQPSCNVEVNSKQTNIDIDENGKWYVKTFDITGVDESTTIYITGHYVYLDDVSIIPDGFTPVNVNVSSAGYATLYYSNKALIVPDGMEAYTMLVADDKVKKSHNYVAGSTIPKGTAVVMKADEGKYTMRVSSEEGFDDSANNMLMGSDTETTTTGGDLYYKLASPDGVTGFYWGVEDGGAFTNGAHKAYLALKTTANSRKALKSYAFHTDDTPTEISTPPSYYEYDEPCYNLQGQRVGHGYKGIVIRKGGKKVVRR